MCTTLPILLSIPCSTKPPAVIVGEENFQLTNVEFEKKFSEIFVIVIICKHGCW